MGLAGAMLLHPRDTAPSAFTSWDSCMQVSYCKWPVVVGIIIASMIVLSILGCIISCMYCGVQSGRGCGCCPSGRSKDEDYPISYNRPPSPPNINHSYRPPIAPPTYEGPQTARFDASNNLRANINDDTLPKMPTWSDAPIRRTENTNSTGEVVVEMNHFDLSGQTVEMVANEGRQTKGDYRGIVSSLEGSRHGYPHGYLQVEPQQSYLPQPSARPETPYSPVSPVVESPSLRGIGYGNHAPARAGDFHTSRPYDRPPSPSVSPIVSPIMSPTDRRGLNATERRPRPSYGTYSSNTPSTFPSNYTSKPSDMNPAHRYHQFRS